MEFPIHTCNIYEIEKVQHNSLYLSIMLKIVGTDKYDLCEGFNLRYLEMRNKKSSLFFHHKLVHNKNSWHLPTFLLYCRYRLCIRILILYNISVICTLIQLLAQSKMLISYLVGNVQILYLILIIVQLRTMYSSQSLVIVIRIFIISFCIFLQHYPINVKLLGN